MTNIITLSLLMAMANVESGGNSQAIGDHGKARGHLQIHRCVIKDVNRIHSTAFTHKDAYNPAKARQIAFLYISHYATEKRLGRKPTQEDCARVWAGGPDGWREGATINYWNKVRKETK